MALLYRSLFSVPEGTDLETLRGDFEEWLKTYDPQLEVPRSTSTTASESFEVGAAQANEASLQAARFSFVETVDGGRWRTSLTALTQDSDSPTWVDVEWLPDDPLAENPEVFPPQLVTLLVERHACRIGPTRLAAEPQEVGINGVKDLVRHLRDPARRLPLVVVAADKYVGSDTMLDQCKQMQERITGLAPVFLLGAPARAELETRLGENLSVPPGAVRCYIGGLEAFDQEPMLHRSVGGTLFARNPKNTAKRVYGILAPLIVRLGLPEIYDERIVALPGFPDHRGRGDEELLDELIETQEHRSAEGKELESLRYESDFGFLRVDEAEHRLDNALARIDYLENRLRALNDASADAETPQGMLPHTAESCQEALGFARQYLQNLSIGETDQETEELDSYQASSSWARKAWRSFRALDSYVEAKKFTDFQGNFKNYCDAELVAIPSTWVTMQEGEATDTNPELRQARMFPVPEDVEPRGSVYMCAHIKIEQGGKPAPRIHFFDDTSGKTGEIHVGYFGKHLP